MQSTSTVSFVCWTLARHAPACFGATSLAWPVSAKAPFNADGDVIFRYHFDAPFEGIILPQILQGHERGLSKCMDNVYWLRGQDLNLRPSGYEPDIFGFQSTVFPKGSRILGTLKKAPNFFVYLKSAQANLFSEFSTVASARLI